MNIKENIKQELFSLINQGDTMEKYAACEFASSEDIKQLPDENKERVIEIREAGSFKKQYNEWYTKSLEFIRIFIPSRTNDFIELYRKKNAEKRNTISVINYGIQDALLGIQNTYNVKKSFGLTLFEQQVNILKGVLGVYESKINSLLIDIHEQLFDDEIDSARKLIKINLRASGALAGVVLEKHLKLICNNHSLVITKKDPSINDYNDILKANNVIDLLNFRQIQYLGDIRNLCDHSKKDEPTLEKVQSLIDGVEKILKTVY